MITATYYFQFRITVDRGGRARARLALTKYAIDLYEPAKNFGPVDDRGSNYFLRKYLVYQNSATNSLGATTINIIRARAKATPVTAANINIDFILDERARELVYEEHRRWTLLRARKWLQRTSAYNKNGGQFATARDTIFPIPLSVIQANLTIPMP